MGMASIKTLLRSVEEVYNDYNGRRTAILRALTRDVDEFYALCDPDKDNLCLYGHPNGKWSVSLPVEEVPPEMPEPLVGINFAREGMERKKWLNLVAIHSDSWLLSTAFYFATCFNANDKKRLFTLINDLPTVRESLCDVRKQAKEKSGVKRGRKSKQSRKRSTGRQAKANSKSAKVSEEDDDEHSETLCGACCGRYYSDEFWIGCDGCYKWYHGKCVKITPAKAEYIKQYKCPCCSSKKRRQELV